MNAVEFEKGAKTLQRFLNGIAWAKDVQVTMALAAEAVKYMDGAESRKKDIETRIDKLNLTRKKLESDAKVEAARIEEELSSLREELREVQESVKASKTAAQNDLEKFIAQVKAQKDQVVEAHQEDMLRLTTAREAAEVELERINEVISEARAKLA